MRYYINMTYVLIDAPEMKNPKAAADKNKEAVGSPEWHKKGKKNAKRMSEGEEEEKKMPASSP